MPKIAVLETPDLIQDRDLRGSAAVIDVLRATSSITQAFSSGCKRLIPARTEEEARSILRENPGALISGERRGLKIEGFDLGNSPFEYSPENVRGKTVIMTTSNGTKAIIGAARARASPVFICSFLNLQAVARAYLAGGSKDLAVVCSGSHDESSLEDFACAGALVSAILSLGPPTEFVLDDPAKEAVASFESYEGNVLAILEGSPHGRYLRTIGFQKDLAYCAKVSFLDVVPVFSDGAVCHHESYLSHIREGDTSCR